jgi:hypothetical protein
MKLYRLKQGTKFYIEHDETKEVLTFKKIDGMFVQCVDAHGTLDYYTVFTPVTVIEEPKNA